MLLLTFLAKVIAVMHQAMYPVACLVELPASSGQTIAELRNDARYAHTFYEIAASYSIIGNCLSPVAIYSHTQRALRSLQAQLAAVSLVLTDGLLFTVLMMGMISDKFQEFEAARRHLDGLATLLDLRGGLSSLSLLLQIKVSRLDLRLAVQALSKPVLVARDILLREPYLSSLRADVGRSTASPLAIMCSNGHSNARLQAVYDDLRAFAQHVNLASQTNHKLLPQFFQDALINLSYRLLHLDAISCDCGCETVRLVMLALSCSVLLHVQDEDRSRYHMLAMQLQTTLSSLEADVPNESQDAEWLQTGLWLNVASILSVLDKPEDTASAKQRIQRKCRALNVKSWPQLRHLMKNFVWVEALHDSTGKELWRAIKRL